MNYVKDQSKRCREEWFQNHKATVLLESADQGTIISWQNPDSWNYGCHFIIHRRWLIVVGDIGEAVYEWSQDLTLEFLAGLDFHYFHGKCQASETGRRFTQWSSKSAFKCLDDWLKENYDESGAKSETIEELQSLTENSAEDEFKSVCDSVYRNGMDPEICSMFLEAGNVPNCRAIGHFVGLQMAIEYLRAAKEVTA